MQDEERITFRVYRPATEEEWTYVTVHYVEGSPYFQADDWKVVQQFNFYDVRNTVLSIHQGWSLISFPCDPSDGRIESILAPLHEKIVLVKDGLGRAFIPQFAINEIGAIDYQEGYQVYCMEDVGLTISGYPVDPAEPIPMPAGWSLKGYLPNEPIQCRNIGRVFDSGSGRSPVPRL
ncbi:hypothetical protein JXO59_00225 [candidate division KSB1 bacterium]|nr:hypothetical protein [candidate division KSB1 bacterium]